MLQVEKRTTLLNAGRKGESTSDIVRLLQEKGHELERRQTEEYITAHPIERESAAERARILGMLIAETSFKWPKPRLITSAQKK
jgi:hypothetical protein